MDRLYKEPEVTRPIARALGVEDNTDNYTVAAGELDSFALIIASSSVGRAELSYNKNRCYLQVTNPVTLTRQCTLWDLATNEVFRVEVTLDRLLREVGMDSIVKLSNPDTVRRRLNWVMNIVQETLPCLPGC